MSGYMRKVNENPETWELQVSTGRRGKDGKYIKKYKRVRGTKRHAEDVMHDFYSEVHGTSSVNEKIRISELVTMYEAEIERRIANKTMKRSARRTYHTPLRIWIEPYIGRIRLDRLDADDIQYLIDAIVEDGKSHKTVKNYFSVMCQLLDYARKDLKIYHDDPTQNVRLPKTSKSSPQWFSDEDVEKIMVGLAEMDDRDVYKAAFLIGLFGGLRVGEVAGINTEDYDSTKRKIHIHRERYVEKGKGIVEDTPKSEAGNRTITLPRAVCTIIDAVVEFQNEQLSTKSNYVDSGALLKSELNAIYKGRTPGDPISPEAVSKAWHRFCDKTLGVDNYRPFHKLRHTHASMLDEIDDLPDTAIQQRMGHSNVAVTRAIYTHAFSNRDNAIADKLEERFFGGDDDMEIPKDCNSCKYSETVDGVLHCGLKKENSQVDAKKRPDWCPYDFGNELLQKMLKEYKG